MAAWIGQTERLVLIALALASSSGIMAIGFVALYAQFMAVSDPRQAGVDFTLLQCMDALVSMIGGVGSGWIAQHYGYGACFGIAAALAVFAIPAVALLSRSSLSQLRIAEGSFPRKAATQQP
jgi:MFS transporter (putative signal transducer)